MFVVLLLKGQANSSSEYLFIPVFFYSMDRFIYTRCPQEKLAGAGAGDGSSNEVQGN